MRFLKLAALVMFVASMVAGCGGAINAQISGNIIGLSSGATIGLTLNNVDVISVPFSSTSSNGVPFKFDQTVAINSTYNVVVSTAPVGQTCSVTNGSGTISASGGNITDVTVTCVIGSAAGVAVTANVQGLGVGSQLVLYLNGDAANPLTITGNLTMAPVSQGGLYRATSFLFPVPQSPGNNYNVTIQSGPGSCAILNTSGSGQIPAAPVSGGTQSTPSPVLITC